VINNNAELMLGKTTMMQEWADYLDEMKNEAS
jgi:hypothetical protein